MSREGDDDGANWHSESTLPNPGRRRVAVGRYLECLGEHSYPLKDQIGPHVLFMQFCVGRRRIFFWFKFYLVLTNTCNVRHYSRDITFGPICILLFSQYDQLNWLFQNRPLEFILKLS